MEMSDYKLTVAFCTIDETFSLEQAYSNISSAYSAYEYLFVLAKSASAECVQTVKRLCKNEKCRYFFQSGKGLGNAIRDCIENTTGSHLILWPADNDMDSSVFSEMVSRSKSNPQKIITISRQLAENGFSEYGTIKSILNRTAQKLFSRMFNSELTDFTNPTQIAPTSVYRQIKWSGTGFELIPEMTFKPLRLGCEFVEVPCRTLRRTEGKKHRTFKELMKYFLVIYKIYRMSEDDIKAGD